MKKVAAIILVALTLFLTPFVISELFLKNYTADSVASTGSGKDGDAASGGDESSAGLEPDQKSPTDPAQEGGDKEPAGTEVAGEEPKELAINPGVRDDNLEDSTKFQKQLDVLEKLQKELKGEKEQAALDKKNQKINEGLLENIKLERVAIERLQKSIQDQKTPPKSPIDGVDVDSTAGGQDESGTSTNLGPKTAKIWADRLSKMELKERILFLENLDEVLPEIADVVMILQQLKPDEIAETLAQLVKEGGKSAADAGKDSEGGKPKNLAARLVKAMMNAEKDAEKGTEKDTEKKVDE